MQAEPNWPPAPARPAARAAANPNSSGPMLKSKARPVVPVDAPPATMLQSRAHGGTSTTPIAKGANYSRPPPPVRPAARAAANPVSSGPMLKSKARPDVPVDAPPEATLPSETHRRVLIIDPRAKRQTTPAPRQTAKPAQQGSIFPRAVMHELIPHAAPQCAAKPHHFPRAVMHELIPHAVPQCAAKPHHFHPSKQRRLLRRGRHRYALQLCAVARLSFGPEMRQWIRAFRARRLMTIACQVTNEAVSTAIRRVAWEAAGPAVTSLNAHVRGYLARCQASRMLLQASVNLMHVPLHYQIQLDSLTGPIVSQLHSCHGQSSAFQYIWKEAPPFSKFELLDLTKVCWRYQTRLRARAVEYGQLGGSPHRPYFHIPSGGAHPQGGWVVFSDCS